MIAKQGPEKKRKKKNKRKGRQQSEGGTSFTWELVKKKRGQTKSAVSVSDPSFNTDPQGCRKGVANVSPHQFRQSS